MAKLPWLKVKVDSPKNLQLLDLEDVPEKPGAYIMLSNEMEYPYPKSEQNGTSRVYYIGRANNLRRRLSDHKRYYLDSKSNRKERDSKLQQRYWPMYEYACYHGCNLTWVISKASKSAKDVEADVLKQFQNHYGTRPVANGQSGY